MTTGSIFGDTPDQILLILTDLFKPLTILLNRPPNFGPINQFLVTLNQTLLTLPTNCFPRQFFDLPIKCFDLWTTFVDSPESPDHLFDQKIDDRTFSAQMAKILPSNEL